jgi:hypothetical protein
MHKYQAGIEILFGWSIIRKLEKIILIQKYREM